MGVDRLKPEAMKRLTAVLSSSRRSPAAPLAARDGRSKVNVPEARRVEILAAKSVVRILNRGAVRWRSRAGRPFVLATARTQLNLEATTCWNSR